MSHKSFPSNRCIGSELSFGMCFTKYLQIFSKFRQEKHNNLKWRQIRLLRTPRKEFLPLLRKEVHKNNRGNGEMLQTKSAILFFNSPCIHDTQDPRRWSRARAHRPFQMRTSSLWSRKPVLSTKTENYLENCMTGEILFCTWRECWNYKNNIDFMKILTFKSQIQKHDLLSLLKMVALATIYAIPRLPVYNTIFTVKIFVLDLLSLFWWTLNRHSYMYIV